MPFTVESLVLTIIAIAIAAAAIRIWILTNKKSKISLFKSVLDGTMQADAASTVGVPALAPIAVGAANTFQNEPTVLNAITQHTPKSSANLNDSLAPICEPQSKKEMQVAKFVVGTNAADVETTPTKLESTPPNLPVYPLAQEPVMADSAENMLRLLHGVTGKATDHDAPKIKSELHKGMFLVRRNRREDWDFIDETAPQEKATNHETPSAKPDSASAATVVPVAPPTAEVTAISSAKVEQSAHGILSSAMGCCASNSDIRRGPILVKGHWRKDGSYVNSHIRRLPSIFTKRKRNKIRF